MLPEGRFSCTVQLSTLHLVKMSDYNTFSWLLEQVRMGNRPLLHVPRIQVLRGSTRQPCLHGVPFTRLRCGCFKSLINPAMAFRLAKVDFKWPFLNHVIVHVKGRGIQCKSRFGNNKNKLIFTLRSEYLFRLAKSGMEKVRLHLPIGCSHFATPCLIVIQQKELFCQRDPIEGTATTFVLVGTKK